MRKTLSNILLLPLFLTIALCSPASAQDMPALLEAIDKIEDNLSALVQREASSRKQEIAKLRKAVEGMPGSDALDDREDQLVSDVRALQREVRLLKEAQANQEVMAADLAAILAELTDLESEIDMLRAEIGDTRRQYASLDEEGFLAPDETNPSLADLTDRLISLQSSLESYMSGKTEASKASPLVRHGDITLGGILHQHYYQQEGAGRSSSFQCKMARLTFQGSINRYARVVIHGEFAANPRLILGYLTFSPVKNWSLSIGQLKPPFGSEFLSSPAATDFVNYSMAKGLGTGCDIGANLSYRAKPSRLFGVKATIGLYNGAGTNTSDGNDRKNVAIRTEFNLAEMFTVAPNLITGKTNDIESVAQNIDARGLTVKWLWRHETIACEYIRKRVGGQNQAGWYVMAGHAIPTTWTILPEIQLLARYEQFDEDLDVVGNRADRLTLGTNLLVDGKYTKLQLNYQINGEESASTRNNELVGRFQVAF